MAAHEFEFGSDTPAYVTVDESGQPLDGDVVMATIELYGREVIPRVRELIAAPPDAGDSTRREEPLVGTG
jgi:hypothetical protein